MMLELGRLQLWSYCLRMKDNRRNDEDMVLDSLAQVQRIAWAKLLFFCWIIFAVGGLGVLGYLELGGQLLSTDLGPIQANLILGALSAVINNILSMHAVLPTEPAMSDGHWLLITLTCGTRGGNAVDQTGGRGGADWASVERLVVHGASALGLGNCLGFRRGHWGASGA